MTLHYKNLKLELSKDVYEPAEDSFLLADAIVVNAGERVLDMGTGTGILALLASANASRVLGIDINPSAVTLAQKNAKQNNITNAEFRFGDLFSGVDGKFDVIIFNPPYLPLEEEGLLARAWSGGKNGIEVLG
ncbi:MAG: methyltransferase, partial [Candidatus Altiarchaeota archaeon]|nr:methyltransferase [Candidatus Altiarchaeota archaeon]